MCSTSPKRVGKPCNSLVKSHTYQSYLQVQSHVFLRREVSHKIHFLQLKCMFARYECKNVLHSVARCTSLTDSLSCKLIWFCSYSDNGLPIPVHSAGETGTGCTHTHTHIHTVHNQALHLDSPISVKKYLNHQGQTWRETTSSVTIFALTKSRHQWVMMGEVRRQCSLSHSLCGQKKVRNSVSEELEHRLVKQYDNMIHMLSPDVLSSLLVFYNLTIFCSYDSVFSLFFCPLSDRTDMLRFYKYIVILSINQTFSYTFSDVLEKFRSVFCRLRY